MRPPATQARRKTKELEKELEQFRQEAQRLRAGRQGGSLPFPQALRAFAVRYATHTLEAGGTVVEAAQKLGVSAPTLYEWRKGRTAGRAREKSLEKSQALVPVRVAERAAQSAVTGPQQVVLVSPSGWRVEGLSVESTVQLLGRLGYVFLFVGRSRRRAKVLYFDGTGLVLLTKRLFRSRFARPWAEAGAASVELTASELSLFLEGCEPAGRWKLSPPVVDEKILAVGSALYHLTGSHGASGAAARFGDDQTSGQPAGGRECPVAPAA